MRAGVALGSNLGDRLENLKRARDQIRASPRVDEPLICSSIYETEPVGCEPGARKFLNAVVECEYRGDALDLLHELRSFEVEAGRPAEHPKFVARLLDLDLLYFGDQRIQTAELTLPHPRIAERRFVLAPLAEIRADLVLPGESRSIAELLAELPNEPQVVRFNSRW